MGLEGSRREQAIEDVGRVMDQQEWAIVVPTGVDDEGQPRYAVASLNPTVAKMLLWGIVNSAAAKFGRGAGD